jgi:sortase A
MLVRLTAPRSTLWGVVSALLIATGLCVVLYSVWFLLDGVVYQHAQRAVFLRPSTASQVQKLGPEVFSLPEAVSAGTPPAGDDVPVFGQLMIPNIHLDVMVGEGVDKQTLRRAVGHLATSGQPGQRGNLVLLGHRDTFFRPLRELQRGDVAEIRTTEGAFRYRIDVIKTVEPEDVDVSLNTDYPEITLVTCYPFYYLGPSPRRFVAQGRLIEDDNN